MVCPYGRDPFVPGIFIDMASVSESSAALAPHVPFQVVHVILGVLIGCISCTYSARDGFLTRKLRRRVSILWLFPIFCGKIPLVLHLGFLSMVVLHPFMILLGLCGPLLRPRYYPNIAGYLLDSLEQLYLLQLDQIFPIGPVQVIFTIGSYTILSYRPQAPPALAV